MSGDFSGGRVQGGIPIPQRSWLPWASVVFIARNCTQIHFLQLVFFLRQQFQFSRKYSNLFFFGTGVKAINNNWLLGLYISKQVWSLEQCYICLLFHSWRQGVSQWKLKSVNGLKTMIGWDPDDRGTKENGVLPMSCLWFFLQANNGYWMTRNANWYNQR